MRSVTRFRLFVTLTTAIVVALSTLAGPPAGAADELPSGFCRGTSGPECKFQYGNVLMGDGTDDGDGIKVVIDGEGTKGQQKVRLTGINAMELGDYAVNGTDGECHAREATVRLRNLIDDVNANPGRVRLAAQNLSTATTGDRLRRSVAVQINGAWQDLGSMLVQEGHVLPHINNKEWAWNNTYRVLAQRAADKGENLWNTDSCGRTSGPYQYEVDNQLDMYVHWNAEGFDSQNVNDEWVHLRNRSDTAISLKGWWLRDSDTRPPDGHGYEFPSGASIPARGSIKLHIGKGTNGGGHYYFGQDNAIFDNIEYNALHTGIGDGAYLFDPQGDLRKWQMYPCVVTCTNRLKGKIKVTAKWETPEHIKVKNISSSNVDLAGHRIAAEPKSYPFTRRTIIKPGETLKLFVSKGKNTRLRKYWGMSAGDQMLNNGGDVVSVRTFDEIVAGCYRWGSGRCY